MSLSWTNCAGMPKAALDNLPPRMGHPGKDPTPDTLLLFLFEAPFLLWICHEYKNDVSLNSKPNENDVNSSILLISVVAKLSIIRIVVNANFIPYNLLHTHSKKS